MGIRSWLSGAFRKGAMPRSAVVGYDSLALAATYPSASFTSNCIEGYGKNEVVFACINKIAGSFPESPLRVYDAQTDEEKPKAELRQLMNRPNPFMSEFELWERTLLFYYLGGNAFWVKVRAGSGRVVELWCPRPDRMKIVPHPTEHISHYVLRVGSEDYPLAREDVVHFKAANPLDEYLGMSPLRAAIRQVAQDNEATDFAKLLLENRATPGVVITTQATEITKETADRLREQFIQKFGRRGMRGGVAVLQHGMDVKSIGLKMSELAFPDLRDVSESRICAVFEVPPVLVGLKVGLEHATYSNYGRAMQAFWEETICPLHARFANRLSMDPDFGRRRDITIRFDISKVAAFRRVRRQSLVTGVYAFHAGITTRDEAREMAGLPLIGGEKGKEFKPDPGEGQVYPRQILEEEEGERKGMDEVDGVDGCGLGSDLNHRGTETQRGSKKKRRILKGVDGNGCSN